MAVGNPQGLTDWNFRAGSLAVQLREILHQWDVFGQELGAAPDATLTGLGMTQPEVDVLRSATADAVDFGGKVFNGLPSAFLTGTHDYTAFIKLLYGVQ